MGISVTLALALREAGLRWDPAPGDRFVLPHRGMDSDVFVLSDMTVEVHDFPTGSVIGFNGVTEWALDSVQLGEALWLPSEGQLRDRLGGLFVRLDRCPADAGSNSGSDGDRALFAVTVRMSGGEATVIERDAAQAYGRALLAVLSPVTG